MQILLLLSLTWVSCQGVDYRKLYREAVIHYKAPDVETGKLRTMPAKATDLLKDKMHFKVFKKNAKKVIEHNEDPDKEWVAEINEFAIETDEEFQQHLGFNVSSLVEEDLEEEDENLAIRSDIFKIERRNESDVDRSAWLPGVKSQGSCGSCYAFSAITAMEYQINRHKAIGEKMVGLSEQQCMDCATSKGCGGNRQGVCYKWGFKNNHWASRGSYPYEGKSYQSCRYKDHENAMAGFTFTQATAKSARSGKKIRLAIANEKIGVLGAAVRVAGGFNSYKSGIFSSSKCNGKVNHAVNIVGYGKLNDTPFWRVRNSWGKKWGDNGYINIKRGVNDYNLNMCRITSFAHYPRISATGEDEDTSNK